MTKYKQKSFFIYNYTLADTITMQKNLTFFEQLLVQNSKVQVKCQTDKEFSYAANQCSWCSTQFVLNHQKLISTYLTNKKQFVQLYNKCIDKGTELRKEHGEIPCGENGDNEKMLKLTLDSLELTKLTYTQNEFIFTQIAPFIPSFALQEFNSRKHTPIPNLVLPKNLNFIMLGRHGQTFTVFPLDNKYLVLDSHVHYAGLMNEQNLIKYIKMEKGAFSYGYLFVTIVGGNI